MHISCISLRQGNHQDSHEMGFGSKDLLKKVQFYKRTIFETMIMWIFVTNSESSENSVTYGYAKQFIVKIH